MTLWGGTNDLIQALPTALGAASPNAAMTGAAQTAAINIASMSDTIASRGAGTVLIANLMDLGQTPSFGPAELGATSSQLLSAGSSAFDSALRAQLATTAAQHPATNFIYMNVAPLYATVASNPSALGLNGGRCISTTGQVCSSPDSYFYWDGLHPTAAGHTLIARLAEDYLYYGDRGASSGLEGEAGLGLRQRALDADFARLAGAPDSASAAGLGVEVDGEDATTDARALVPSATTRTGNLRIVVNHPLWGGMAGAAASLGTGTVDATPLAFDETAYGGDIFYGWRGLHTFIDAAAGLTRTDYAIRRSAGLGSLVQTANTQGWSWAGAFEAGLILEESGFEVSPRLRLSFDRVSVDAYQESGIAAQHDQGARDLQTGVLDALVRIERAFGGRFGGFLEAGYERLLGYDAGAVVTGLVDNTALVQARDIGAPYADEGVVSAGLSVRLFGGLTGEARYTGRLGALTSNGGALKLHWAF